ncbi:MAG: bifunctional glutamate N-acetyltransferase/amino-acid acetyltransferase ArgJ, partial [Candidatus Rokubacteria bacterium]|nr:bifunctional glutamate N-acetyltransferase/amino-acid acetyltransferase ArgJ [Candidatus Rokubacteria bacterium]
MADMQWLDGGITAVPGILASGVAAGIKPSGKKDLALIYSSAPARAAAVFTTNQVKGAPVVVSQEHIRDGRAQAILASSGCANVCTGEQGIKDAREITKTVGELLRIKPGQVLIAATGVIGQPLPMDKIRAALPKLVKGLSPQGGRSAAEAIMTTDTRLKEAAIRIEIGGRPITIGGIAKGVGMLEPHLATMFCFLATDAMVASDALPRVLKRAADASLNRITVDGDQSTSDTVAVLANGLAENAPLERGSRGLREFARGLEAVMAKLARMLVADGEGATKLIEVKVSGGRSQEEARRVARTVVSSPLVKSAIHGNDPNWGRVLAAAGRSGVELEESKVDLSIGGISVARCGRALPFDAEQAVRALDREEVSIALDMN